MITGLVVLFDPVTQVLHAVGYDGAPARYFRSLGSGGEHPITKPAA